MDILVYTFRMKRIVEKIRRIAITFRAKALKKMLNKTFSNSTSKTIISSTEKVTLNSKSKQLVEEVIQGVSAIAKTTIDNPQKLLDYVEANGTKVYQIVNANKFLEKINEHTGLITELKGIKALYVNILTGSGIGFKSKPMFIISNKKLDYYMLLREFYLWYSLKKNLPGFDFKAQEKFKKYIKNLNKASFKGLNYGEMLNIQEAISRDKEANDFVIKLLQEKGGDMGAFGKITSGGANF